MRVKKTDVKSASAALPKTKSLKINALCRDNRGKNYLRPNISVVPEIRLSGFWLEDLGFCKGGRVLIVMSEGELILRPVKGE